jgi:hypothetical protein
MAQRSTHKERMRARTTSTAAASSGVADTNRGGVADTNRGGVADTNRGGVADTNRGGVAFFINSTALYLYIHYCPISTYTVLFYIYVQIIQIYYSTSVLYKNLKRPQEKI